MNENPTKYELPVDSDEARRLLDGIIVMCEEGEEWYDYDEEENVASPTPPAPHTPRLTSDS